jgi:hypothetical protein
MMTVLSVSSGGERGGTVGTDGRLVGFVGGVVGSGGSVDMGLGPFIQFGHRRDLYKLHDKTEADGLPKGFAGAFVSDQLMLAPLLLQ